MKLTLEPTQAHYAYLEDRYPYPTVSIGIASDSANIYVVTALLVGVLRAWSFDTKTIVKGFAAWANEHAAPVVPRTHLESLVENEHGQVLPHEAIAHKPAGDPLASEDDDNDADTDTILFVDLAGAL
jgi:hypothetical protein